MLTKRRKDDFVAAPLSMHELVEVLAKHYGVESDKFDLAVEFQIGTGPVGPDKNDPLPGVIFGIKSVALRPKPKESTARPPSDISIGEPIIEAQPKSSSKKPPRTKKQEAE
jgi:hypothetical protein